VLRDIVLQVPRTSARWGRFRDPRRAGAAARGGTAACVEAAQVPDPPPASGRARPDPVKAALVKKLTAAAGGGAGCGCSGSAGDAARLSSRRGRRDGVVAGWRRAILGERPPAAL
jgi:hypothetical protein